MSDPAVVETAYGKVRGLRKDGVLHWRGIPYAAPPLGPLRFLPPRPPAPWAGERDATRFGALAEQSRDPRMAMMSGVGQNAAVSEDCLVLNVTSPAQGGARRPVVVWIHGGAFIMGSGSQPLYNGTSFAARHDLVVVTLNYRLGVFGMLYLGDLAGEPYRQGNVALLDQIAALRWVRENIAAFGGDPARITVMGESAGAISIGCLLGMPAARGLFDRAILQSGAPALGQPRRDDATAVARAVLAELGAGVGDLAAVPTERLLAAQDRVNRAYGISAFVPFVDGETIPRPPTEAVRDGDGARVPILLGTNRDEWTLFDLFLGEASTEAMKARLRVRLGDAFPRTHAAYLAARADRAARPSAAPAPRAPEAAAWLDAIGDAVLRVPVLRLADAHARHAPTWMYRFDWESPAFDGRLGATHALELPLVWNVLDLPVSQVLLNDLEAARPLAARLHAAWAAFIRGDAPGADGLPAWPIYDELRRATMLIDREPRVADDPDAAVRELWRALA